MSILHKIVIAGVDCLAAGGGGSPEFYKRQIAIMSDLDRATFANLLKTEMPELTDKFQKIQKYEAWFQTMLVEHRWYSKIRKDEFWQLCRVGVNDSNVTPRRLERNLRYVLDKFVPDWELDSVYEGDDLSVPNVEYYMLGELDDARATFLGHYPNATWPAVDEEVLAKRRAAEAEVAKVKAEEDADFKRMMETFPEVRPWSAETGKAVGVAERRLAELKSGRHKIDDDAVANARAEVHRAQAADEVIRKAQRARQQVQMKRLEEGLPMYGPDEGPERLDAEDNLGSNLGST